jgi:hypothetical protein
MGLDELLDAAAAEAERADWLKLRNDSFGCSDLGALWLILGWAGADVFDWHEVAYTTPDGYPGKRWRSDLYVTGPRGQKDPNVSPSLRDYVTPRYLMEQWKPTKHGIPRLIAEKAGLVKPKATSDAQEEGLAKEALLFDNGPLGHFSRQTFYAPRDWAMAPPDWKARAVSKKPLVLRDSVEPRLTSTIEAWEYVEKGCVAWELKTDRNGYRTKAPWAQRLQSIGQAVVMGADGWGIVYGPGWARTDEPSFPDMRDAVQWGPFAVKDEDRAMIREAVRLGWVMVEAARARQKESET